MRSLADRVIVLPLRCYSVLICIDRLVDFVVYRQYGLMEEEVAVVEGSPSMEQE